MERKYPEFTITHHPITGANEKWLATARAGTMWYGQHGRTPQEALQHLLDAMIEGIGSTQQEEAPSPPEAVLEKPIANPLNEEARSYFEESDATFRWEALKAVRDG